MITFRRLEKSDFTLLYAWLTIDFVSKWYQRRKFVYDDVEKRYFGLDTTSVPVNSFIVLFESIPIGYIQSYPIKAYPDYMHCVGFTSNAVSIDMFIGDKQFIGKNIGKDIITSFVDTYVFVDNEVKSCIICPNKENTQAIRMLEKAGFKHVKTVYCDNMTQSEYVMVLKKI